MRRIVLTVLVDDRDRVLLQERDEHAPWAPNQWSMVGGHVEEGEDFEPAAYRELEEETGLTLPPGALELWHVEHTSDADGVAKIVQIYAAKVTFTNADIVLGEGRQIVFVDPAALADLDMADTARTFTETFLESDLYRSLCTVRSPAD